MTDLNQAPPRRRPQFTLKGLFVLLTILGVFLAWLGIQIKWVHDRHGALQWVHQSGHGADSYRPAPWSIRWVERGVPFINIDPVVAHDPEKVRELKRLFPEAVLNTPLDGLPLSGPHRNGGGGGIALKQL